MKIYESKYGDDPLNFHVYKHGNELKVELTYPPWSDDDNTNDQCQYIVINQESVRASDGVRLHYNYDRDGFVVQQPTHQLRAIGNNSYDDDIIWIEVGFFPSWRFDKRVDGTPTKEEFAQADAEYAARKKI